MKDPNAYMAGAELLIAETMHTVLGSARYGDRLDTNYLELTDGTATVIRPKGAVVRALQLDACEQPCLGDCEDRCDTKAAA